MLKSPLFWKMTTLFGAVLLLLIPIMLIRQVIVERADYRSDVEDAIRQSTSGPQKLVGPLIAIPVTELYTVQEEDKTVERKRSFIHFWLPESLMVDGNQNVEERKIGIYTGQVWHSDLTLKADFDVSRLSELNAPNITLGKPFIVISVGDARGIGVVKAPEVNGTALTIEPGTGLEQGGQGSLVMFYLLLLALSEHIGFTVAWIIASLIGALMNGIYLQAVLKGWRNSMLFTLALLLLDGVMWGLLNSADSALLLGTSVLVVALAGMMFVTRNIDWYAFSLPKMKASKEVTSDDELRIWK
ncbi:hypothetical protein BWR13_18435 [Escherichia coli]|nr:hypothetical protein BWR13_18435 [Escherichia coli]